MSFTLHPQLAADSFLLGRFALSQLRLINDQQYPWFILVPEVEAVQEIYQLADKQSLFWQESAQLSDVIMQQFNGDKLNLAALGNMVPQLHIHHIVRYQSDPCWPKPVWGQQPMQPYQAQKVLDIQRNISKPMNNFNLNSELKQQLS
jgi:diadenosine tetraphosphate (Ap4A) HIT family hydrolase